MYYFASDIHLGLKVGQTHATRERLFVRWLDEVSADAEAIFLVGDVFDFWYEYRRVVPKGFTRLLGKLSELTDRGVAVHFFPGNHDLWAFDYLQTECGVVLHRADYEILALAGKRVFIGHGDVFGKRGTAAEPGVSQPGDPVGFLDIRPSECGDAFRPLVERFEP